jgi:hypothetical protein
MLSVLRRQRQQATRQGVASLAAAPLHKRNANPEDQDAINDDAMVPQDTLLA